MSFNTQQTNNISENSEIMVLYLPRVHMKHSSRDIRTTFIGLGFGQNISVDIAHNPKTGFNMAFVFIDNTYWAECKNLKILRSCLLKGNDIRVYPEPETSREFWMILPSNADHKSDESKEILENAFKPTIQLDVHVSPVNAKGVESAFLRVNDTAIVDR